MRRHGYPDWPRWPERLSRGHVGPALGLLGFGLLEDTVGNDHCYCGGLYVTSYRASHEFPRPATPGYEGFGQGVGAGIRPVGDGGIGIILNGGGHNVYEFDYLSHGGGYWCGMGFARDFGGNSQRLIARTAWNGSPRTEPLFQRFGCGWGCHYSVGFLFDDGGNSLYEGTIMGAGMGWDCSVGALCSFGEKDHFKTTGGLTQGCGRRPASVFFTIMATMRFMKAAVQRTLRQESATTSGPRAAAISAS